MITILFACRNFNNMAGGIERMASLIMNEMVKRGHKVDLITWDSINRNLITTLIQKFLGIN